MEIRRDAVRRCDRTRAHEGRRWTERAGQAPQSSRYASSARSRPSGTARPSHSAGRSRARSSRCSRSSRDASSPSTGSSRRSGPANRPRRPRTPSRSTSRSSARRSAPSSRRARRATCSSSSPSASTSTASRASRRRGGLRSRAATPPAAEVALREALALWRGPALADFLYEPFAQTRDRAARGAAHRRRSRSGSRPISRSGRHAELVSELEALVQARAAARAPARAAHARALPLGPAGRRARRLPRRARDARRGARHRARPRAPRARGRDPPPGRVAAARGDAARPAGDAVPPARHDPLRRRRRVDGARGGARPGGARRASCSATSRPCRRRSRATAARSRSTRATRSWPRSASRSRTRTTRSAPRAPRSTSRPGSPRSTSSSCSEHGVGLEVRIGIETGEVVATPTDARQRLVTGEAVGIAAKLEAAAGADEIVVGEVAARLIDHAARARAARRARDQGQARAGARVPAASSSSPIAPAFERRLDAPLVGRKRELAALRRSLKRAVGRIDGAGRGRRRLRRGSGSRGSPPSSRAARRASRRSGAAASRTATASRTGRCARSLARGAGERGARRGPRRARGRDAAARARDRLALPPLLRGERARAAARRSSSTTSTGRSRRFLELVEHLADKGEGPILVVCLAREELLEERPDVPRRTRRTSTASCSTRSRPTRPRRSLDGLGGGDPRVRPARRASSRPPRATRSSSSSSSRSRSRAGSPSARSRRRSRRCSPRASTGSAPASARCSSAVRSSGRSSRADDVVALLDPDAAPTADTHLADARRTRLRTAARRRRVRLSPRARAGGGLPRGPEAAARGAARALRRPARRRRRRISPSSTSSSATTSSRRTGCGRSSASRIGEHENARRGCGRRLGDGGCPRAQARRHARDGEPARPCGLAAPASATKRRHELMCELGIAQHAHGGPRAWRTRPSSTRSQALRPTDIDASSFARASRSRTDVSSPSPRARRESCSTVAEGAIPTFEALDDDRSLARAWLLIGYVHGGIHGNHAAWEEAEERALVYYRRSAFPPATCMQQIAAAIYWGPTPCRTGSTECAELARGRDARPLRTSVDPPIPRRASRADGRLRDGARAHRRGGADAHGARRIGDCASSSAEPCGQTSSSSPAISHAAEATFREQCEYFERKRDRAHLAVRAAKLAEALYRQGRLDEAERLGCRVAIDCARATIRARSSSSEPVEAKLSRARGAISTTPASSPRRPCGSPTAPTA